MWVIQILDSPQIQRWGPGVLSLFVSLENSPGLGKLAGFSRMLCFVLFWMDVYVLEISMC